MDKITKVGDGIYSVTKEVTEVVDIKRIISEIQMEEGVLERSTARLVELRAQLKAFEGIK